MTALGFGRFAYTALLPGMKTDLGLTNTLMGFFQVAILTGYLLFAFAFNGVITLIAACPAILAFMKEKGRRGMFGEKHRSAGT